MAQEVEHHAADVIAAFAVGIAEDGLCGHAIGEFSGRYVAVFGCGLADVLQGAFAAPARCSGEAQAGLGGRRRKMRPRRSPAARVISESVRARIRTSAETSLRLLSGAMSSCPRR